MNEYQPHTGDLPDRLESAIRAYPQWSAAEHRRMDAIVAEVLEWCRSGRGGRFCSWFWDTYLREAVKCLT